MPTFIHAGATLNFKQQGNGQPLLLIHGLGSSLLDWEHQLAHFAHTHRVIAVDLRGHGDSTREPGPFTVPTFAADLAALLKYLGLTRVHAVGISLGGAVALQLALDHPRLVRTLTIVNSGPYVLDKLFVRLVLAWRLVALRLFGVARVGRQVANRLFPGQALQATRDKFTLRFAGNDPDVYRQTLRGLRGWNVADRLGELGVPTLVLASEHDDTPVSAKQAYLPHITGATLEVIAGAHHQAPMECPERFNAHLEKFLARQR